MPADPDMATGPNGKGPASSAELAALDYAMLAIDTLLDLDSADPAQVERLEADATKTHAVLLSLRGQIARGER